MIRQIFEVSSHFAFHQPDERIEPAGDAHHLADEYVYRVVLTDMRLLVRNDLADFAVRMRFGVNEYPLEEGERTCFFLQQVHAYSLHFGFRTVDAQAYDASQLDKKEIGRAHV